MERNYELDGGLFGFFKDRREKKKYMKELENEYEGPKIKTIVWIMIFVIILVIIISVLIYNCDKDGFECGELGGKLNSMFNK
jgi:hypothetical protein